MLAGRITNFMINAPKKIETELLSIQYLTNINPLTLTLPSPLGGCVAIGKSG